jgi:hypothetical protein
MPSPQVSFMTQYAKNALSAANIPALRDAATRTKYESYITAVSTAICNSWRIFQSQAKLIDVVINGPTASRGRMTAPPIAPLFVSQLPRELTELSDPVANAFSAGMAAWTESVSVPGLPWYPSFVALPMPVAPPTPNVPCVLRVLNMNPMPMSQSILNAKMVQGLPRANRAAALTLAVLNAMASSLDKVFTQWLVMTQVTNVMGTGPVPTFAPPYVPVGPVVGGAGNMMPGGLI